MLRVEGSRVLKMWVLLFVILTVVLLWSLGVFDGFGSTLGTALDDLLHALNHEM